MRALRATRHWKLGAAGVASVLVLAMMAGGAARAADGEKAADGVAGSAVLVDEAGSIEARLIDLAVRAGTLKSLQNNEAPVDTGMVPERQTTPVAQGLQDGRQIAVIDDEIGRLAARYKKLTGLNASVLAGGMRAGRPMPAPAAEGAFPGAGAVPGQGAVGPAPQQPAPGDAGGWFGKTTVSPGNVANGAGELLPSGGAVQGWPATPPAGQGGGVGGYGQANGGQAYGGQVAGGAGDTSGGRAGEVLPPGIPYPGTEDGSHAGALASLDQARRPAAGTAPQPVQPGQDVAEAAYEQAYSYLLQQDYGAAQFAFAEFLSRHGDSPLAGNAQYWLGEIHFVQGRYREAARAFLTGYETYGDGHKGADSLFKLALSLDKLNQSQAACSSLNEFFRRYASAEAAPVEQANEARQRLKCRS